MPINSTPADEASVPPKICFILGILHRSGTNYVHALLKGHPDVFGQDAIPEDFLVHASGLLKDYVANVHKQWNPIGEVDKKVGPPATLFRDIGEALRRFLQRQIPQNGLIDEPPHAGIKKENRQPKILLTKTPSVMGAEHFFDLFPNDYLILLVRDGRAVVESGVRSFGWKYEDAIRNWAARADSILTLRAKYKDSGVKFLILKYEDVVKDEKGELLKVFDFLGLDPGRFDFERAKSLGVIGSSETRKEGGAVHWKSVEKKAGFNPTGRFGNWDRKRHDRFNWLAGRAMTQLGYPLEETGTSLPLSRARNQIFDLLWKARKIASLLNVKSVYSKGVKTLAKHLGH